MCGVASLPSLISGVTEAQPRQSHCTAEAVVGATEVSAVGNTEVARSVVRAAGNCAVPGDLSEVSVKWRGVLRLARNFLGGAAAENYDTWICSS